ncbi:helix-hairpin-helix domain-containing protein [Petrachloros mirabilis]
MASIPHNRAIARKLLEVALLLEEQEANRFRVQAYRRAAETLEKLKTPASKLIAKRGIEGLQALPGIGVSLSRSIHTLVVTGRLPMLDRLRGELDSAALLASIPGIGPALAKRLHDDLHIQTLEQLEMAAHDGRLTNIEGIGTKKLQGIIDSLAARLGRIRQPAPINMSHRKDQPSIAELLDVDREYRESAKAGKLRLIAPRRFNPRKEAWLPILHTQRGERHYTAMFSNTALAHRLKKTHEWVILYFDDEHGEHQCTIVTGRKAPLTGKRIVRGRETNCTTYYEALRNYVEAGGTTHAN